MISAFIDRKSLRYIIFFFLSLCGVLIGYSCHRISEPPIIKISALSQEKGEVFLKEWEMIVPIKVDLKGLGKNVLPIDNDYLSQWGFTEANISNDEFKSIGDKWSGDSLPSKPVNIRYKSKLDYISLTDIFNVSDQTGYQQFDGAAYYAITAIESDRDQDAAVLTDGDDNVKVWINGHQIFRKTDNTPNYRNNGISAVRLKKGINRVMVKTFNLGGGSSFYVSLSPINYAKEIYLNKRNGDFLNNSLLKGNEPLSFSLNKLFFNGLDSITIKVNDVISGKVLEKTVPFKNDKILIDNSLKFGRAYTAKLIAGNDSISQHFFIGDTAAFVSRFRKDYGTLPKADFANSIDPILIRYDYLNTFAKENGYDFAIERKVVYCIYEMDAMARRLGAGLDAFSNIPGLHMRSYLSKIDGQQQYYMIYIPEGYNSNRSMPLVVEMPWIANTHRHFLKGWRVADFKRVNMIIRQAQIYGYAFLWSCSRTYNEANYAPLATASSQEELAAVKKLFNIDSTKIYLFGSCLGGGTAMMCASRNPNEFAAVGVEGPALDNVPLERLENFKTLPVYIAHSEIDKKASFKTSYDLSHQIKKHGGSVAFVNLNKLARDFNVNFYPEEIVLRNIFSFFKGKQRNFRPDTLTYTFKENKYSNLYSWLKIKAVREDAAAKITGVLDGNSVYIKQQNVFSYAIDLPSMGLNLLKKVKIFENNKLIFDQLPQSDTVLLGNTQFLTQKNVYTSGPINDVFSDGFVLVQGTKGKPNDRGNIQKYTTALSQSWQKAFNDSCQITTDKSLSEKDFRNKNLILIGTPATNDILKRIAAHVRLKVSPELISIGDHTYNGSGLVSCFVYPNPYSKKHYVLIITSNDLDALNDFAMVPWYAGNKDFYVYQNGGEIDSGNFNQLWK